jgi:MscS family membrane protein
MVKKLLALLLLALPVSAQEAAPDSTDQLGRTTPKTSFLGFLRHAHAGNYDQAADYLDLSKTLSPEQRAEIARKLEVVLDRGYEGKIEDISTRSEAPPGTREVVGVIVGREQTAPVTMIRRERDGRPVWLFSRETVALAPQFFTEFGFPAIEAILPRQLIETHFLDMPVWSFLAILLAFPVCLLLAWALNWVLLRLLPASWNFARRPHPSLVIFLGLILHSGAARFFGLPLIYRVWYGRVLTVLWIALVAWAIFSLISHADRRIRDHLAAKNLTSAQSLLQLGRRLLKVLVLLGALLAGLRSFGYDITAVLAGLGIGGLAIAFAAQKTLENVFGGLTLLSDQSIRVGDACQINGALGVVEDIGLRATRFRTIQRSLLYVPNGQLATMNIENLGQRDRILFRHTVGVTYRTSPAQMRALLEALRHLLSTHEMVAQDAQRVRFISFGASSLNIEVFAQILTNDFLQFLAIQEELMLQIMDIVAAHGCSFAFPSQSLYIESISGDAQKA